MRKNDDCNVICNIPKMAKVYQTVLRQLHWWDYKPWSCASKKKCLGLLPPRVVAWHVRYLKLTASSPLQIVRAPSWGQGSSSIPIHGFKGELLVVLGRVVLQHLWNIPSSNCIVIGISFVIILTKYQSKKSQIASEMPCDRRLEAEPNKKMIKMQSKHRKAADLSKSLRRDSTSTSLFRFFWFDWPLLPQSFQYYQCALKITTPPKKKLMMFFNLRSVSVCLKTDKHPRRWLGRWLWFWLCLFRPLERRVSWKISSKRNQKPTLLEVLL